MLENSADSVTTEFELDLLALIEAGDQVVIRPYWTLATLFPPEDAGGSYLASASNSIGTRRTEILTPDLHSTGINRSANGTYFFNGFWRKVGNLGIDHGDLPLLPDAPLTIRGNNDSGDTTLSVIGEAPPRVQIISLRTAAAQKNDNPVGLPVPVALTLDGLSLHGEGGAFTSSASNSIVARQDELLVFDDFVRTKNPSAGATYFHNGFWRKVGDLGADRGAVELSAGGVIVIRKQAGESETTDDWRLEYDR